ncbi:MAG TPA: LacI family DNA-binding transcriptional regulator [Bryobacteraceae bacterium]|nr:LacI family DNA-binding transcriptional regulator [Bryobacteraceae bacterium]
MAVRLKDIAEELNVSVVTVSKVLRNEGDISEETRRRVLKRAKELNYQPNWVARGLVMRKTFLIGLVLPDLMHSFFAEVAQGVSRRMRSGGYNIVISYSQEDPEVETQEIEGMLSRRVDGLIVASAQPPRHNRMFRRIEAENVPYVLIDRQVAGVKANFVGVSDEMVGRIATEHLIAQGCRRIAHIRGPETTATSIGRCEGFLQACAAHKIAVPEGWVIQGQYTDEGGFAAMQQALQLKPRPDAVYCYNDPVAAGALKAALSVGLRIPQDIAVMGSGNVHYSDLLRVPLSTIDQCSTKIGESAADLLLDLIKADTPPKPRTVLLSPSVVARESTLRGR